MALARPAYVRHNFVFNVFDGGFYGLGLYTASYVTVLPLFIATMTDSPLLIGMVYSVHTLGWQLPQLLTAGHVARLRRYLPFVMLMTLHERLPYVGLLLLALALPQLAPNVGLILTFILITWQSLGAGIAATPWQAMIAKIMPRDMRGRFYGVQSALAQLFGTGGAALAYLLLERLPSPYSYAACFAVATVGMLLSYIMLAQTREHEHGLEQSEAVSMREIARYARQILSGDSNFRWFSTARVLAQVGLVAQSFFAVYAVQRFGISDALVGGAMMAVMLIAQCIGNPVLGWLGDQYGFRVPLIIGALAAVCSALAVLFASGVISFFIAFALGGIALAGLWSVVLAMLAEFGTTQERPYYIGLGNTLVAPFTLLAPIIGGWLAESLGYGSVFTFAALSGALAVIILFVFVRDPKPQGSLMTRLVMGTGD